MMNSQYVLPELKRMQAEHFFSNPAEAEFITAVGLGELGQALRLLEGGVAIDVVGNQGMTALYWAIAMQNLAGFQFLLEHGAKPDTLTRWVDVNGQEQQASVIELAAMLEDSSYLRALLDAGANPNQVVNASQHTAIYNALLNRRYDNVSLLIEAGGDINHRSKSSKTPIAHAVGMRAYAAALLLLRAGADPCIENNFGYSAVDTTRQFGSAGTVIGSEDEAAYPEFVAELKVRGFWDQ